MNDAEYFRCMNKEDIEKLEKDIESKNNIYYMDHAGDLHQILAVKNLNEELFLDLSGEIIVECKTTLIRDIYKIENW